MKRRLASNFGWIVIGATIAFLSLAAVFWPNVVPPAIAVPVATALVGLVGVLWQLQVNSVAEAERRSQERRLASEAAIQAAKLRSFEERKEAYAGIVGAYQKALAATVASSQDQSVKDMIDAKFDFLYYGSGEALHAFQQMMALGDIAADTRSPHHKGRRAANLVFYARLVRAMRRDLGIAIGDEDEIQILRMVLTDPDSQLDSIKNALAFKEATEVP